MTQTQNPLKELLPKGTKLDDVFFVCIGTDRSTGDSLGPLVGTKLMEKGYTNVIGTLEHPVHAVNLVERLKEIPGGKIVIAIDACLGQFTNVGKVHVKEGSLKPGAGVKKELPPVGDFHIIGIVNVGGFMEYFVLQNTRLSQVMKMADEIVEIISNGVPKEGEDDEGIQQILAETTN